MKNKVITGLVIVLMIVLLIKVAVLWIPGVIDRYDRQQNVDPAPDTLTYLLFGIGEDET
ncbi:MAG: hypothetical protein K6G24_04605 [Lachnospiraceae bacterium]|nr:hypothetical protein [Lachnospiraceae bacterium]